MTSYKVHTSNSSAVLTFSMNALLVILGSAFLSLMSHLSVPLYGSVVPQTMQTLGVFLISSALGKRIGTLSIIAYLLEGTCGFPVFAGGISLPLWFVSPTAGFLFSFPVACFCMGWILERIKNPSFFKTLLAVFSAQIIIWLFGSIWLSFYCGPKIAFYTGIIPFIPGAVFKCIAATSLIHGVYLGRDAIRR